MKYKKTFAVGFLLFTFIAGIFFAQRAWAQSSGIDASYRFTRTLTTGSSGEDVLQLQKWLNTNGFMIAPSGPGSPGNETRTYGRGTANAIIRFQEANAASILTPSGITKGTGRFATATREFLNKLLGGIVLGVTTPESLWSTSAAPAVPRFEDPTAYEFGTKFSTAVAGTVTGIKFYKGLYSDGTHVGNLWSANGTKLASVTFTNETASGWQTALFSTPVSIQANTTYVISYFVPGAAGFAADADYFNTGITSGNLSAPVGAGVFNAGASGFPTQSYRNTNYWVDVLFVPGPLPDTTAPSITLSSITSPVSGSVTLNATATDNVGVTKVQFQIDAANINGEDTTVPYQVSWNSTTATNGTHTLTAVAYDAAGNTKVSNPVVVTVSNTTTQPVANGQSLWSTATTPSVASYSDPTPYELGVKFSASTSGTVTGIRFYKGAQNTGTHTGSLWDSSGTRLATGTFVGETASGWQTLVFSTPVPIQANTLYTASYFLPVGYYAADRNYFAATYTNGYLSAPVGAGVYNYATSAFPANSTQNSNYWVDVLFVPTTTTTTPPSTTPDTTRPSSASITSPTSGATVQETILITGTAADNVGIAGMQFQMDSANVGAEDIAAPYELSWNSRTVANGTHYVRVIARDAAGNTRTSSQVRIKVSNTTTPAPDTSAPVVSFSAPAANTTVSGTTTVTASASDNIGVVGVQFKLDGVNLGSEDATSPYAINWDTTTVANGTHTLTAVARDAAGNATTATISVTVSNVVAPAPDTTAPTVALSSPVSGATVSGVTNVAATASDNRGVVGVQFKLDGVNLGSEDATSPYAINWDTTTVANGTHTLTAVARDAAGNTKTSTAVSVTVNNLIPDTTAPSVSITSPIGATIISGVTAISASASDNVGVAGVTFKYGSTTIGTEDTTAPYSVSWDTKTVPNASYSLTAVARDAAGNTKTSTVITVSVNNVIPDTTAPSVSITSPISGASVSGLTTVTASASDNIGVVGVQFKLDGVNVGSEDTISPYSISWDTTTAANGTHTLSAVARDAAGNATTGTVSFSVNNTTTPPTGGSALSFSIIPYSDPDLNAPGRGVEQWHGANEVNVPNASVSTPRLDKYFRFSWAMFESTQQGVYNWTDFDTQINGAIDAGQKFSFGIMTSCPGCDTDWVQTFNGGGTAGYPVYLHNLMQAESPKDWRSPDGDWVPNYNSPTYLARYLALTQALNAHIQNTSYKGVLYKNVINEIDIRGYGAWGEWHSGGGTVTNSTSEYPAGTFPTITTLKKIVDAHTQGFPNFPLVAMIAAFDANYLSIINNPPEIAYYVLTQTNNWGRIGWRRDQWGATDSYLSALLENNTRTFNNLPIDGSPQFKDAILNRWKTSPITGEPPGWATDYNNLEGQIRLFHANSFGNGNYGGASPTTIGNNIRAASKAAGYRLILEGGNLSSMVKGSPFSVTLNWKNVGIAPTYENWNVVYELKNSSGAVAWSGTSSFNPKLFLPQTTATAITDTFTIPSTLPSGTYTLTVKVKDANNYRPQPLPLAIQGIQSDGSYIVKSGISL